MYKLINSTDAPQLIPQFLEWIENQWGNAQSPESLASESGFPAPIFAVENDTLLGGLAFTQHIKPDSDTLGVWINALYVAPEYRKRGIAACLIQKAEAEAQKMSIDEIYVYTDTPVIYQKQGWVVYNTIDDHTVLQKGLSDREP